MHYAQPFQCQLEAFEYFGVDKCDSNHGAGFPNILGLERSNFGSWQWHITLGRKYMGGTLLFEFGLNERKNANAASS